MKRERWLILAFVPALMLLNAFVVLNYTGLAYQPFSWKAFAVSYPPGEACMTPSECTPVPPNTLGFCVDEVCCESACTGVNEQCDLPGREGECVAVDPAPAPALSGTGLLIAALLLAAVGTLGLVRNRRQNG
jgi:hypothetical protein